MPEELQSLLEKIQKDGVDKAENDALEITSKAKEDAKKLVEDAESNAADILKKAEQEAAAFSDRAKQSLAQAARDVILSVGQALDSILSDITATTVADAISDDTLKQMIVKAMETYCQQTGTVSSLAFILNEKDAKTLTDFLMEKYRDKLNNGVEVKTDNSILGGFTLSVDNNKLQQRIISDTAKREQSIPTVPSLLSLEKSTNPFLRCDVSSVIDSAQQKKGNICRGPVEVFATIRSWKDNF